MIHYHCAVCDRHLYDREQPFVKDEIVGATGLTRPDGQPVNHGDPIHYCGCKSPPVESNSLVERP